MSDQENTSSDAPSLVGSIVAGRYQVEKLLGAGAMGAVFKARHIHMQKSVALKVLHQETSENAEVVTRFEREAIAAGRIAHPNVAGATDFGRLEDGSFYLVLEYVAGKSLGQLISDEGTLPPERALGIFEQILMALSAAHHHEIVHRDLKPENVMLLDLEKVSVKASVMPSTLRGTLSDADIVKVLDFGLAKLQKTDNDDTQLTMVGAIYGTPQYMAPEQASGQEVDHRADLYAAGLIFYEMLSGAPPFTSDQMMPLLLKHMTEEPPPLSSELPRSFRKIVDKLLEKKPEDRYQSADEVLAAIEEYRVAEKTKDLRKSAVGLPSMASFSSMASSMPRVASTVDAISTRAGKASRPAVRYLKRDVTIRGHKMPRWVPVGGGLLCLLVFAVVLSWGGEPAIAQAENTDSGETPEASDSAPAPREVKRADIDPELRKVLEAAAAGSDSALYALDQREDDERSAEEWVALATARIMRRDLDKGLVAYKHAIDEDGAAVNDVMLVGALRRLADDDKYTDQVLHFVAENFGSTGPDFLFHVWSKTSAVTKATTRAFELLGTSAVKNEMSPALKLALEFREAESCSDYKELLPRVQELGDDRLLSPLRDLLKERGCGTNKREDCYPCLRDDRALTEAVAQAGMRKSPQFELLRRWRWK